MSNAQLYQVSVTLTDAQIKSLADPGIQLTPAPGVGKMIFFVQGWVSCDTSSEEGYGNVDSNATVVFTLGSLPVSSKLRESVFAVSAWLDYQDNAFIEFGTPTSFDSGGGLNSVQAPFAEEVASGENVPLSFVILNGGAGNLTGGDPANTMKIVALYTIIDV